MRFCLFMTNMWWNEIVAQKKAHEVDNFLACLSRTYPVVLVYGPDKGLASERAALYAKNSGVSLDDPFSTIRLDAAEIDHDPGRLGDEARTVSLFGGDRLIWIRNAETQKGLAEAVRWLLQEMPAQTFVLIEAGDLKKGAALRNAVEQAGNAMALPCYSDDARGLDHLIDEVLSGFGLRISLDAREILHESLGADRLASRGELEKLCFYAKDRQIIGLEDVAEAISDVSAVSLDEVIDAVISGNLSAFDDRFDRHVASGTSLFSILNAAQRQFQQLQEFCFIMNTERKSAAAIVAAARPPVFFRRQKLVAQALAHWNAGRLARAMERLHLTLLESRKNTELAPAIVRQNLLALTVQAMRAGRH